MIIRCIWLFVAAILSGCAYHPPRVDPHYAPVTNGQIEYYQFGTGSPIIFIPGYATDVSSWDRQFLASLAQHHQIILLNNRNVGGSLVKSSHYESRDLANDVFQLIKDLHLKKPAVLGISMGGMIAQQVAALHPDQVGELILINTAISGHKAVHPSPLIEKKMLAMPKNKLGFYFFAIHYFFPPGWKLKMAYSLAVYRFKPGAYKEIDRAAIMPPQQQLVVNWLKDDATAEKISHLPMPVLILNGEADIVIPPINSSILAKTIPHSKLIRWKEGGHAMIYQYPLEIAQAINQFIENPKNDT